MPRLPVPLAVSADYQLDQIVLAPNWRSVTWTGTQHVTQRIYMLSLATHTVTTEPGLIVGLAYHPTTGWRVADEDPNFCGLLPPDWDLVPFEAANACGHTPP